MSQDAIEFLKIVLPVFLFTAATIWGVIAWLVNGWKEFIKAQLKTTNEQIAKLGENIRTESGKIAEVEKGLLKLRAELPAQYVRREDHIRYSAIIETKLDNQAAAIHNLDLNVQRVVQIYEGDKDDT